MIHLPRLAVGTLQRGVDCRLILWALTGVLRRGDTQVQSFHFRSTFMAHRVMAAATGLSPRHLDSWLMSRQQCQEVFLIGSQMGDVSLVYGKFAAALDENEAAGGKLEALCDWLDLPRLVVLDVPQLNLRSLPDLPVGVDGLLLDRVSDFDEASRLAADLETLWRVPVLGALPILAEAREALEAVRPGGALPEQLSLALGEQFVLPVGVGAIHDLAVRRGFDHAPIAEPTVLAGNTTVAVAHDDAFHCYFPDTLEALERRGATVVDFSPLRDEDLPEGCDVVYIGCGWPDRHADVLSENHCMKVALRRHLREGRRIYAEGGGAAYLCQSMSGQDGRLRRMVGIFAAESRRIQSPPAPWPVEATSSRVSWLGPAGTKVKGYRSGAWQFEPVGTLPSLLAEKDRAGDMVGGLHAVGSLLQVNFAMLPHLMERFIRPHGCGPAVSDPWTAVL